MKKENKFIIILIIVFAIILGIGLFMGEKDNNSSEKIISNDPDTILANAQNERIVAEKSEKKEFTEINVSEYMNYYSSDEKTIVLIARPTCHYCQIAEPILEKMAYDYDLDIKYLNTDKFEEDDSKTLSESNEFFSELGTPTLLIVSEEQIIDSVAGLTDTAHYVDFFKKNKFIK